MKEFAQAAEVSPRGAFASSEAYSVHRTMDERTMPTSMTRASWLAFGPAKQSRPHNTRSWSNCASDSFDRSTRRPAGYDAMLMPTVPDTAPTIAEVTKDDESYFRLNGRMLRNPALVNLFDGAPFDSLP